MILKKQIASAIATLALGAALIGGGTFAYFSDTATSSGNTFATGTIIFGESTVLTANTNPGLKPGDLANFNYSLVNGGTLNMGHVYLKVNYSAPDINSDNLGSDLGTQIEVKAVKLGGVAVSIASLAGTDGKVTLDELKSATANPSLGIDLGNIPVAGTKALAVETQFIETNASQNQYQGETATITFTLEARNE